MCASRIFLTGQPGIGKTTAIRLIARDLEIRGKKVEGMISSEIRSSGERIGFQLEDIFTHKVGILAHSDDRFDGAPTVGKYYVNIPDIERIGAAAIRKAAIEAEVVIVDEIGPMELKSTQFILAVEFALASKKNLIGTIHKNSKHPLVNSIKSNVNCRIIELNSHNRGEIPSEIVNELTQQVL
ncbi:MAG: NTPase [Candidatus Bathyarchaeia archaeon]|jgi:nucleoside-triphosphatase